MKAITISKFVIVVLVIFAFGCKVAGSRKEIVTSVEVIGDSHDINTFTNPLLPSGADPWAIYHKGNYYYIKSGANAITLMRTPDITDLKNAEKKIIWTAPNTGDHSKPGCILSLTHSTRCNLSRFCFSSSLSLPTYATLSVMLRARHPKRRHPDVTSRATPSPPELHMFRLQFMGPSHGKNTIPSACHPSTICLPTAYHLRTQT